jgi:hypothetical protein
MAATRNTAPAALAEGAAARWRLPRPAALAWVSAALVLIGAAAGAPTPLYGLYQQRFGVLGRVRPCHDPDRRADVLIQPDRIDSS